MKVMSGVEVGYEREVAFRENEIADDIARINKGRRHISFSAAARYLGVKEEQARGLLIDIPRCCIGKREKINVLDLAKYIMRRTRFMT